ncbi:MAG: hypothetical protein M1577_03470, partial [Chloroflexi bacterium]|nr:hypothetical protein [Chloroflexota bacterium]
RSYPHVDTPPPYPLPTTTYQHPLTVTEASERNHEHLWLKVNGRDTIGLSQYTEESLHALGY